MKIFRPFIDRKPWAAALLSVVLGAPTAMLYLNRGWLALGYLLLLIAVVAAPFAAFHSGLITVSPYDALDILNLAYVALGALHAFLIARRFDHERPLRWYARWRGIAAVLVSPILLALLVRTFLFEPFNVPSISMEPNLPVGSVFFANKLAYASHPPERGDIVLFYHTTEYGPIVMLSRIIGIPGDTIQLKGGLAILKGQAVVREKIQDDFAPRDNDDFDRRYTLYQEMLPNGRSYQILEESDDNILDNTAAFTVPEGHYFVMGDNRDNSRDSRVMEELGYIPQGQIFAKAAFIIWDGRTHEFSYTPIP